MPWYQNVLEKRFIALSVVDVVADQPVDPSGYGASIAFVKPGVLPTATDWVPGTWTYDEATASYFVGVLVGPDDGQSPAVDTTLAAGTYVAFVQINTGNELLVGKVDTVTISSANYVVPVVSADEQNAYMGYPFNPEQLPAVQIIIDALTAQLATLLKADLSVQQYTEEFTVPGGMTLWNDSIFGTNVAEIWQDQSVLPLGLLISPVYVKHFPVVSWDALAVKVPAEQGPTIAQTTEPLAVNVTITQVTCTPLTQSITSGPIVINDLGAPGGLGNTLQANTSGASIGSTVIPLDPVQPLAPIVSGANIMEAAGTTWVSITPPTVPEDLPEFLPGQTVQVTYTAGWDGATMPDVKTAILRAAARELTNRLDEAVGLKGGLNTTNLPDGPGPGNQTPGFLPSEIQPLKRYKKRVII